MKQAGVFLALTVLPASVASILSWLLGASMVNVSCMIVIGMVALWSFSQVELNATRIESERYRLDRWQREEREKEEKGFE